MTTASAAAASPSPYETALGKTDPSQYKTLGFWNQVKGWWSYKLTGLWKSPDKKAEALFANMQSELTQADSLPGDKKTRTITEISERYGRALSAAVNSAFKKNQANKQSYINAFVAKAKEHVDEERKAAIEGIVTRILGTGGSGAGAAASSGGPPPLPQRKGKLNFFILFPHERVRRGNEEGKALENFPTSFDGRKDLLCSKMKDAAFETTFSCFDIASTLMSLPENERKQLLDTLFDKNAEIPPLRLVLLAEALVVGKKLDLQSARVLMNKYFQDVPIQFRTDLLRLVDYIKARWTTDDSSISGFYKAAFSCTGSVTAIIKRLSPQQRLQDVDKRGTGPAHTVSFEEEKNDFLQKLKRHDLEYNPDCYFILSEIFNGKELDKKTEILNALFVEGSGIPPTRLFLLCEAVALKYPDTKDQIIQLLKDRVDRSEWAEVRKHMKANLENHPLAEMYTEIAKAFPPDVPARPVKTPVTATGQDIPSQAAAGRPTLRRRPMTSTAGPQTLTTVDQFVEALQGQTPNFNEIAKQLADKPTIQRMVQQQLGRGSDIVNKLNEALQKLPGTSGQQQQQ